MRPLDVNMVEGEGTGLDYGYGRKLAESVFKKGSISKFKLSQLRYTTRTLPTYPQHKSDHLRMIPRH